MLDLEARVDGVLFVKPELQLSVQFVECPFVLKSHQVEI
jgi:hypothetical protein